MKKIDIVSVKLEIQGNIEIRECVSSPKSVAKLIKSYIGEADRENLIVVLLDTKNKVNSLEVVSTGSLNSTIVHPREVFKSAILSNAASIIIAHNHPSGDVTPSREDENITARLKEASRIIGIELLDHIILGYGDTYLSFKEKGLI
ncbi:MAG: DNA repair protein RadC [Peptostreptococcaceae bacterium]